MRKHCVGFALIAACLVCFAGAKAMAESWVSPAIAPSLLPHSLIVKVHKHCTKVFVCDYFAPATSCSVPPCCKKGHWEKTCVKD
ncbi:MAG: hypothetical protein ACM3MH_10330 [Actinomycetota bacterium]